MDESDAKKIKSIFGSGVFLEYNEWLEMSPGKISF